MDASFYQLEVNIKLVYFNLCSSEGTLVPPRAKSTNLSGISARKWYSSSERHTSTYRPTQTTVIIAVQGPWYPTSNYSDILYHCVLDVIWSNYPVAFGILMLGLSLHIILISHCDPEGLKSDTSRVSWQIDKVPWFNPHFLRMRLWCLLVLLRRSTNNMKYCHFLFQLAKFDLYLKSSSALSPTAYIGTIAFTANCKIPS